jgi:hypothetical protein
MNGLKDVIYTRFAKRIRIDRGTGWYRAGPEQRQRWIVARRTLGDEEAGACVG